MHLFALCGFVLIAVGVGLVYLPAGVVTAGIALVVLDRFGVDL